MGEFNIWDLERVSIKINENFLKEINDKLISKYKDKNKAYEKIIIDKEIPFTTFKNILKPSNLKLFFVPLKQYIKIVENLGITKESLHINILAYKTSNGANYIETPILPIKITPVFDMLLAHNIGDGTVINPKNGRLPYFGYRQFNKFYRLAYIKKIENIFGKIKFKENYFEFSTRPYCPPVLSSLFFKYYNLSIEDFLSDKARIPQIILDKGKDSMLAVLIAFIIDEGNIDSTQITIGLKNKGLIEDLKKICECLEYKSKITENEKETDYTRLHILREGMKKLYTDYLEINKKYPSIDLGIKGERIDTSFKIYNRIIYKNKGNKDKILELLKKENLSVNQISVRINMTRQGVRYHIHKLIKEGKIRIINNQELNWIYGI